MRILIKNGLVVDPANKISVVSDILIENSRIFKVAKNIDSKADRIIDAVNKIIMPGLVDMHVHLREPGREDKETIASGTKAALKGGVTSMLAMPNTQPPIDTPEHIKLLKSLIKKSASANIFIASAITKMRAGKELAEIEKIKKEGALAITDDGSSIDSHELMQKALKLAKKTGVLLISHCEDKKLSAGGVVNLGLTSTRMGLRGISKESEFTRVKRDIELARKSAAAVHITHISCLESVEIIAQAKKRGIRATCDTAPHYFSLSEEDVLEFDANMKMNPPLRSKADVKAIKQGLADGTIDAIASDHAPHTDNEKEIEFERAEFGVIGLETELAAAITELINPGLLSWEKLVERLSLNPAKILGLTKGRLDAGSDADIAIVSPKRQWRVDKSGIVSKSKNCAFLGRSLQGVVEFTICGGEIAYEA